MASTAIAADTLAWDSPEYHRRTYDSVRDRVHFIEHRGKHILLSDFSHSDPDTGKAVCAAVHYIVQQHAQDSVRSLISLENHYFDDELIAIGKEVMKRDKPFIRKTAVVGLSGMMYILFQTVSKFSQRHIEFFRSQEEALNWLAQD